MKLIRIRRLHLILGFCILAAAGATAYVCHRHDRHLDAELPPMEAVVPKSAEELAKLAQPKKKPATKRHKAVASAKSEPKVIALTFDDGPHPVYTERLLKILHDEHVPATFFVVGKQVELHPDLVREIFAEGHELANHTYSHRDMRKLTPEELVQELDRTERLVEDITCQPMKFFRPPGGQYNREVVAEATGLGYTMTLWTVFPQDHTNPPEELIRSRVLSTVSNRGVILFHSGVEHTIDVLPEIIETLKDRGYRFITISQLAAQDHAPAGSSPFVHLASSLTDRH